MSLLEMAPWLALTLCLTSTSATAQPLGTDLKDAQIRELVAGNRLELRFSGTPPVESKFLFALGLQSRWIALCQTDRQCPADALC